MVIYHGACLQALWRKNSQKWDFGSRVNACEILIMLPNCSIGPHSHQQYMNMADFAWSPQKSVRKHLYQTNQNLEVIKYIFNSHFSYLKKCSSHDV